MKIVAAGGPIFFSRLLQVLANGLVVMLVADRLGTHGQGLYSLTVAVIMFAAALLNGGMGLAAVPSLRQGKVPAIRMLQAQALWIGLVGLVLAVLPYLTRNSWLTAVAAERLGWTPAIAAAAAVAVLALLAFDIFNYDLLAVGRLVVGAGVNLIRALLHLAAVAVLALLACLDLSGALVAYAAAQLCAALALGFLLRHQLAASAATAQPEDGAPAPTASLSTLMFGNLRRGWIGQMSAITYLLLLRLDQGLVEVFQGAAAVGIYSLAVWAGEMLWLIPGALTSLLVHSSAAADDDQNRDAEAARAVRVGLALILCAALPVGLVAPLVFNLLAGGDFATAGPALWALLPGIVAFAPGVVLAGDFIGRGRPSWNTQASLLTVLANVAWALYLIPRHGIVGAAWASTLAYLVGGGVMVWRFHVTTGLPLRAILVVRRQDFRRHPG